MWHFRPVYRAKLGILSVWLAYFVRSDSDPIVWFILIPYLPGRQDIVVTPQVAVDHALGRQASFGTSPYTLGLCCVMLSPFAVPRPLVSFFFPCSLSSSFWASLASACRVLLAFPSCPPPSAYKLGIRTKVWVVADDLSSIMLVFIKF